MLAVTDTDLRAHFCPAAAEPATKLSQPATQIRSLVVLTELMEGGLPSVDLSGIRNPP